MPAKIAVMQQPTQKLTRSRSRDQQRRQITRPITSSQGVDSQQQSRQATASPPPPPPPPLPAGRELVVFDVGNDGQDGGSGGASDATYTSPQKEALSTQQQSLLEQADGGDLQSRLDLVSLDIVEVELGRCRRRDQPNQTILDFLQHPGDSVTPADAAAQVLNELADETEETALKTVFVWRYIQLNEIWKTHTNPKLRSMQAFLRSLDQDDIVMANIVVGTTTQNNKRRSILAIHKAWGPSWFDSVPRDLLPPDVTSPFDLSKRLLLQIAATSKQETTLKDATVRWRESMQARFDSRTPRSSGRTRTSRQRYLIPDDLDRLGRLPAAPGHVAPRTVQTPKVQQDRIELKVPAKLRTLAPKLSVKRKRVSTAKETEEGHPQKRLSKDGTKQLVRVRNHLIVRPVSPLVQSLASASSQANSQDESTPPSAQKGSGKSIFVGDNTDESEEDNVDVISSDDGLESCEGSVVLQRLIQQVHWSQESRECCTRCRKAIVSIQYAIDRASATIRSSHSHVQID